MIIFEKFKNEISSKYTPKRTKVHHLKKFLRGGGGGACSRALLSTRMTSRHANFQI